MRQQFSPTPPQASTTSAAAASRSMPQPSVTSSDFYTNHRFQIELQGISEALFSECSGLSTEIEMMSVVEGGQNGYVLQLPVRIKQAAAVVLRRGLATPELWQWFADVSSGAVSRRNFSIVLLGREPTQPVRWDFIGGLPVKWSGPEFKAGDAAVAFETLELIHNGFKRVG